MAAREAPPCIAHRLLADVVEDEYEEALHRVEDAEDVLEGEAGVTHRDESDDPRQSWANVRATIYNVNILLSSC